jgi:hypothetical protein
LADRFKRRSFPAKAQHNRSCNNVIVRGRPLMRFFKPRGGKASPGADAGTGTHFHSARGVRLSAS